MPRGIKQKVEEPKEAEENDDYDLLDSEDDSDEENTDSFGSSDDVRSTGIFSDRESDDQLESGLSYSDLLSGNLELAESDDEPEPVVKPVRKPRASKKDTLDPNFVESLNKMNINDQGAAVLVPLTPEMKHEVEIKQKASEPDDIFLLRTTLTTKLLDLKNPPLEQWQTVIIGSMLAQKVQYNITYDKDIEKVLTMLKSKI